VEHLGEGSQALNDIGLSRLLNGYNAPSLAMRVDTYGLFSVPAQRSFDPDEDETALEKQNNRLARGYYLSSFEDAFDRYLTPFLQNRDF
jgi:hypothetical protein